MTPRMRPTPERLSAAGIVLGFLFPGAAARVPDRGIDVRQSSVRVSVLKAGLFSILSHDHLIAAPLAGGRLSTSDGPEVDLRFDARTLRVIDPGLSPDERAQIQKVMEGPKVLDAARHPEIRFRSTAVEPTGVGSWSVQGTLTLHGQTQPLRIPVTLREGRFCGSVTLRQTDFGIVPVRSAGGAVRVRDEVRVEFEIAAAES